MSKWFIFFCCGIEEDTKDLFSVAGASHILALSGMHIGIILFLFTFFVGGKKRRGVTKLPLAAIIAVWIYVVFAGLPFSAIRSAIMLTIWYVLYFLRRGQHPLNVLGTAALLMIVCNPEIIFDAGFQMSYMSVFFILLCMPYLIAKRPFQPKKRRKVYEHVPLREQAWKWIWSMICISIVAQLGTAPLSAYHFGRFSYYFLLSNVIVIPMAMIIIYGSLLMIAIMAIGIGIPWVILMMNEIVGIMTGLLKHLSALPGSSIEHIEINTLQVLLLYIIIGCVLYIIAKLDYSMPKESKYAVLENV